MLIIGINFGDNNYLNAAMNAMKNFAVGTATVPTGTGTGEIALDNFSFTQLAHFQLKMQTCPKVL